MVGSTVLLNSVASSLACPALTVIGGQGHALLVAVKDCGSGTPSVSDTAGNSFASISNISTATAGSENFFIAYNVKAGSDIITAETGNSTCFISCGAVELGNTNSVITSNGIGYGGSTSVDVQSGTMSLSVSNEPALLFSMLIMEPIPTTVGAPTDYGTGTGTVAPLASTSTSASGGEAIYLDAETVITGSGTHGIQRVLGSAGPNWSGAIVALSSAATPTPTPTSTPSPTPTPSGNTFTPVTFNGINYGAGGTTLPTLSAGYTTYTCTGTSSDVSGLQTAINSGHDVLIEGTECYLNSVVVMAGNQNVQCQNSSTILYNPNTASGGAAMLEYEGVSNSTFSNCTLLGANTVAPSGYPGGNETTGTIGNASEFLILGENINSNITIVDNVLKQVEGQAAIEFVANSGTNDSDIYINWNSAYNCSLYSFVLDAATNSEINHNYSFDCMIGNELDFNDESLAGTVVNYNYQIRDQYGDGYGCVVFGSPTQTGQGCNNNNPYSFYFFCGADDAGGTSAEGCSATGNLVNGQGSAATIFNAATNGTGSNNYIWDTLAGQQVAPCSNGSGTNGCINSTPPNPAPSGP